MVLAGEREGREWIRKIRNGQTSGTCCTGKSAPQGRQDGETTEGNEKVRMDKQVGCAMLAAALGRGETTCAICLFIKFVCHASPL